MNGSKYLIIILFSFILSCRKDKTKNPDEPIENIEYLWKVPLFEGAISRNSTIRKNLIFGNELLISSVGVDGRNYLINRKILNGSEVWRWDERFFRNTEEYSFREYYNYNGLLTYTTGSRHYCINLKTGQSQWRIQRDKSYDAEITGIGNDYFILGDPVDTLEEYKTQVVFKGNLLTGEIHQYLLPDINFEIQGTNNLITNIEKVTPFIENSDTLFLVVGGDSYPNWYLDTHIGLYSSSKKKWIYSREKVAERTQSGVISNVIINRGRVYLTAGQYLACHDLKTGKRIWRKNLVGSFLFSGFILEGEKIFANNEGGSEGGHMYALDTETGDVLWKTQTGGTSSTLRYLNGIVYMSGGSSNRIHAIDGNTGKHVWKLDPQYLDGGISNFKWDLYAWEGDGINKGRVVVCTGRYAYCFEAYQ